MSEEVTSRTTGDLPVRSAADVAGDIPADATMLVSGFGSCGYPKAVPLALAADDRDLSLTVISGGSAGDEIDTELMGADAIARRIPYQARSESRERANDGRLAYQDYSIYPLSDEVLYGRLCDPDVAVVEAAAVGPDWFVPTMSLGHTPALVAAADELVVELNENQPLALQQIHDCYLPDAPPDRDPIPIEGAADRIGSPTISFDPEKLVGVVETDRPDDPYSFREPTDTDLAIADNLAAFLREEVQRSPLFEDSVRVQFGVGSLGNALMSALGDVDFGDRDLIYFGEVIQDGLLDLVDEGVLESASATSLALSEAGQERLFADIDRYAESFVLRPANVSNRPALIDRLGIVAVNSALEVDIYGHVNSTHVNGTRVMNGVGGSPDFTRNSHCAVIALPSTAAGGDISRIVPMVPHVDHTEHDVQVVVTEQGVADLRGTSPTERAAALVEHCAHPDFRQELQQYRERAARQGGHIHHDLDQSLSWHADR